MCYQKPLVPISMDKRLRLLLNFLKKETFISMYVGCIISLIGPMLYCTVLPTVFDQKTNTVSEKCVADHLAEFKRFIDLSLHAETGGKRKRSKSL